MDNSGENSLARRAGAALVAAARAKSEAERLTAMARRVEAECFLRADGSVEQRKATARTHARYVAAEDEALTASSEANVKRAKADAFQLLFEEWRSNTALRRAEMTLL